MVKQNQEVMEFNASLPSNALFFLLFFSLFIPEHFVVRSTDAAVVAALLIASLQRVSVTDGQRSRVRDTHVSGEAQNLNYGH